MRLSDVTSVISDYTLGTVIATFMCALERRLAREQEFLAQQRDGGGVAQPAVAGARPQRVTGQF